MLFSASAKPAAAAVIGAGMDHAEPSLFRRKMESAGMLPSGPAQTDAIRSEAGRSKSVPANPNVRQYLLHLASDSRRLSEAEVRNAVVGVTPTEVERVARAVAKLRGRYLAQVVDAGAAAQGPLTRGEIDQLRLARENFEEMEAGFNALRRAIEAGEIPLEGVRRD
jgi:hypothetical protein